MRSWRSIRAGVVLRSRIGGTWVAGYVEWGSSCHGFADLSALQMTTNMSWQTKRHKDSLLYLIQEFCQFNSAPPIKGSIMGFGGGKRMSVPVTAEACSLCIDLLFIAIRN